MVRYIGYELWSLLVTFRVALHYVRPDNYHVFRSCDVVVELGLLNGT